MSVFAVALLALVPSCSILPAPPLADPVSATVVRVIDGDTIEGEGLEPFVVRLLGIDAPEVGQCGGAEATQRLEQLLPPGADVQVVADPVSDATDRFGRHLAYIETTGAGDLGAVLVSEGLTGVWWPASEPKPTRAQDYEQLRDQAKQAGAGSWKDCGHLGREWS